MAAPTRMSDSSDSFSIRKKIIDKRNNLLRNICTKMEQQEKKISFSFSKIIKKPELNIKVDKCNEKKIDYIKCVDDKSIKVFSEDEKSKDELLIIPMLGSKSWHDRIVNRINANIHKDIKNNKEEVNDKKNIEVLIQNSDNVAEKQTNIQKLKSTLPLDKQAAQEIINDLEEKQNQKKNESLVIEQFSNIPSESQEPTLENYEEIPIEKFGVAMLRGMGWNPDKGIGKNAQVIKTVQPTLRPKGIGLGADKIFQHNSGNSTTNSIKLKIEKGSYVKIVAGNLQNNYGIIESFDDDSGRIIVKLALTNKIVSLNEVLVQPITKTLYEKNSRVINALTYEKYKNETASTIVKDELLLTQSKEVIANQVKNNTITMRRDSSRTSSSSDDDSYKEKSHSKKSRKHIQSKKKKRSYDSKRHCNFSEFHGKIEKKKHKKEKKRHKDEKYQLHKHKRSRS